MSGFLDFTVLGSGSAGNAFAVASENGTLLVDAGFSCKELCARMRASGIEPESVQAVLLTHGHSDHVRGCRVFCDRMGIQLYAGCRTAGELDRSGALPARVYEFEPGTAFVLAGFEVTTFPVSHDASDPVGFVLKHRDATLGMATDLGAADETVRHFLAGCNMLALESNYDESMLEHSGRPPATIRRIRSRIGHLGNTDAIRELRERLIGEATRMITLLHVSRECNDYGIVSRMAQEMLREIGRQDICLEVARQESALPTFHWSIGDGE